MTRKAVTIQERSLRVISKLLALDHAARANRTYRLTLRQKSQLISAEPKSEKQ